MSQGKATFGEETKVDATQQNQSPPTSPLKGETGPNYEAFVKNLPFTVNYEDIKKYFEQCGTVERVNVLKNPATGRSKGVAFVRFSDEGSLQKALGLSGQEFEGRNITVEKTVPKEQRPPGNNLRREDNQNERDPNSTSVFVGNLSYNTSEDSLRQLFDECGAIKEIRIATDPSGRSRGFAHVDFEAPESVEKAVQKTGEEVDGRNIRVDFSNKRQDGGSRGGFRGGFNRGSGGFRGGSRGGSRGGYSRGGSRGGYDGDRPSRGGYDGDRPSRGGYDGDRPSRGGFDSERGSRGGFRGSRRGNN